MSESAGDKKHEASQYRREQAREQGQVARSQDLGSAVLLLGLIFILNFSSMTKFQESKLAQVIV